MIIHMASTSTRAPCGVISEDAISTHRTEITCPGCQAWIAAQDDSADRDLATLELAREYRKACEAVQPTWLEMLDTEPGTLLRRDTVKPYTDACQRVLAAKAALLDHVRGGASEVGR